MAWRRVASVLLGLALGAPGLLHADAGVPILARHVTDYTDTLTAAQVDQLDAQLVALQKAKGAQLLVLMVGSIGHQSIEQYSLAVAEANKLGRKGTDDGVLLLVARDDRRVRIEVGHGLEGAIPDAANARIIRVYITPNFRARDYFGGISGAVGALSSLINGEPLPPPIHRWPANNRHSFGWEIALGLGYLVMRQIRGLLGGLTRWFRVPLGAVLVGAFSWMSMSPLMGALGALFGAALMLLPIGSGRSIGGGGWGGFGGWGGGGFGGGGGGFSGGGGSFGGGGSSGSW